METKPVSQGYETCQQSTPGHQHGQRCRSEMVSSGTDLEQRGSGLPPDLAFCEFFIALASRQEYDQP